MTSEDTDSKNKINPFLSQFVSDILEHRFRQHSLAEDKNRATIIIVISIVALLLITGMDYRLHGMSLYFFKLAVPKSILLFIISMILIAIWKTKNEVIFDRLLFAFLILFVLSKIYSGVLRPPDYLPGAMLDVVIIMAAYLGLPVRIIFRFIPLLILTVFSPFVIANKILFLPHFLAHLFGFVFSKVLYRSKRNQFLLFLNEEKLKEKLQEAEDEVLFVSEKLAEQNNVLKEHAAKDQLTGIHNRRSFNEFSEEQWSKAVRKNEDCSVILIDIDHFKSVNDTYGHPTGDKVLKEMVTVIEKLIRLRPLF